MIGEQLLRDGRYAMRVLSASPLFSAMAVLSLALGIGANTAIYSFMDAILLRALPVHHPESLVVLNWHAADFPAVIQSSSGSSWRDNGITSGNMPYVFFEQIRGGNEVLASTMAYANAGRLNLQ